MSDYEAARRELLAFVDAERYTEPAELARLVVTAPAFHTLTASQWWNVALCLAQYGSFPK